MNLSIDIPKPKKYGSHQYPYVPALQLLWHHLSVSYIIRPGVTNTEVPQIGIIFIEYSRDTSSIMWLSKLLILSFLVVFGHMVNHKDTNNDSEATPSDLFTDNTDDLVMYHTCTRKTNGCNNPN